MPPLIAETPPGLVPFRFHGVEYSWNGTDADAYGDCVICDRDSKWSIDVTTSQYQCFKCGATGNGIEFIRWLYYESFARTEAHEYTELARQRKLLYDDTLIQWGAARSLITGDWLLPAYDHTGKLHNVYVYSKRLDKGQYVWKLWPTPGVWPEGRVHGLFGVPLVNPEAQSVHICEGPWDGMALWELLRVAKPNEEGFEPTGSKSLSVSSTTNVVATPGANIFNRDWTALAHGKRVFINFDNDHPHTNRVTGKLIEGTGIAGVKRVARDLAGADPLPSEVKYLRWGDNGYDKNLPHGYDVRDMLTEKASVPERVASLSKLYELYKPVPAEMMPAKSKMDRKSGVPELATIDCRTFTDCTDAWRQALRWGGGLDISLSVILAAVASTGNVGDQLWIKLMGPPSSGKTSLVEALAVAREYTISRSTVSGFHSGYKTDRDGDEDNSMIPHVKGKTFIIKDGDTLLKLPNREQVLSQARDLYDRVSRVSYKNGIHHEHGDISMTFILCGTGALDQLDASELGERFLTCKILDNIDLDEERAIARRGYASVVGNFGVMANGSPETHDSGDMIHAKQVTGGYVKYLRQNASALAKRVRWPSDVEDRLLDYASYVSVLRARPSKKQDETTEREMCTRLTKQLTILAGYLAVVLNTGEVNERVMKRVRKVAVDTSSGKTQRIMDYLYNQGNKGGSVGNVASYTQSSDDKTREMLYFLKRIQAIESFHPGNTTTVTKWRLTARMRKLYEVAILAH